MKQHEPNRTCIKLAIHSASVCVCVIRLRQKNRTNHNTVKHNPEVRWRMVHVCVCVYLRRSRAWLVRLIYDGDGWHRRRWMHGLPVLVWYMFRKRMPSSPDQYRPLSKPITFVINVRVIKFLYTLLIKQLILRCMGWGGGGFPCSEYPLYFLLFCCRQEEHLRWCHNIAINYMA